MRILFNTNQPNIIANNGAVKKTNMSVPQNNTEVRISFLAEEENDKKAKRKSISAMTVATLVTVFTFILMSRNSQKNINKLLNKIKDHLEEKSAHTLYKDSKKRKNFYEFSIRRINFFIKKSESINNITSLKDILFMKLMYKTEPTKKIHQLISNYFEEISKKTVDKSYENTKKRFDEMYKIFDELDDFILKNSADEKVDFKGKEYTKKELVEMARDSRELTKMSVDTFMNDEARKNRYDYIKSVTNSLYSTFWEASFKNFWSKNNKFKNKEMWQTFIAAEQIKGNKTQLATWSSYIRNAISYTKNDEVSNIYEYVKAIDDIIPIHDTEGIEITNKLKWFAKNTEVFENNKELFFKELEKLENHKIVCNYDSKTEQTLDEYKKTNIELIQRQIKDNQPGALQDMLAVYYKVAPFELEKTGALMSVKKAVKSFDETVDLECVEMFDKVRDLRLGSAPTDVLTVLFSFITLSLGLGHAKDRDKKVSVMLKSGIPIIGALATAMYSATKLVSGGKSLALGILSGIVLNRLGIIAENIHKNKKPKVKEMAEDLLTIEQKT